MGERSALEGLEKLPDVTKVRLRFETKGLFVTFDPKRTSTRTWVRAVKKQGYEAEVDKSARWPEGS